MLAAYGSAWLGPQHTRGFLTLLSAPARCRILCAAATADLATCPAMATGPLSSSWAEAAARLRLAGHLPCLLMTGSSPAWPMCDVPCIEHRQLLGCPGPWQATSLPNSTALPIEAHLNDDQQPARMPSPTNLLTLRFHVAPQGSRRLHAAARMPAGGGPCATTTAASATPSARATLRAGLPGPCNHPAAALRTASDQPSAVGILANPVLPPLTPLSSLHPLQLHCFCSATVVAQSAFAGACCRLVM